MKERLFFDGIDVLAHQASVDQAVELTPTIFPYLTDAAFAVLDLAAVAAKKALHLSVVQWRVEVCFPHDFLRLAMVEKVGETRLRNAPEAIAAFSLSLLQKSSFP